MSAAPDLHAHNVVIHAHNVVIDCADHAVVVPFWEARWAGRLSA